MEVWYTGTVEKDVISLSNDKVERIQQLVGDSYKVFAERAMGEKHRKKWDPFMMLQVIMSSGSERHELFSHKES